MKGLAVLLASVLIWNCSTAENFKIKSPDGRIELSVDVDIIITYSVFLNGNPIISPSTINLQLNDDRLLGDRAKIQKINNNYVNNTLYPIIPRKYKVITDEYNKLTIEFKKNYLLCFRVYNDGAAYRWETTYADSITVISELATFNFNKNHKIWFPEEEKMFSHQERVYHYINLSEIMPYRFCSTGALIDMEETGKVLISESDLLDYPGMFLKGNKENPYGLQAKFAGYPSEVEIKDDRNVPVVKHDNFLAKTKGTRTFPWRVIIIAENDAELIESEMIWKLASPAQLGETSWIKPGKVAWDWWNDLNIYDVDFKAGINTKTYKYYIDFAHEYQLDYIILDEGWYHLEDVLKVKDEIDMDKIVSYANSKGVGVILWVTWKALDDKMDEALKTFEKWGIKGIKVDFMQRDDQWMVNYYTRVAKNAAKHKLLVDFHGAYKPTGLHRTYPNVLTFEGVAGMEQSKWGQKANPENDLILPFIRMVAGPIDYTPGAMINATQESFRPVWSSPMSQGTRCHQLAMYVVYESPLQMLSDNPTNYRNESESMKFLSQVPVTWDETRVIEAKVSDYIVVGRKKNNTWYVGGMTDWSERDFEMTFDFLDAGEFIIEIWQDGTNADKQAKDFATKKLNINRKTKLNIQMAPGGGWAAIITPR